MLLSLSSCPSNMHMSNSLFSTTLLTFIKESCTWFSLRLRSSTSVINLTPGRWSPLLDTWGHSLVIPLDPQPCLHGRLELPILRSVYSGLLFGTKMVQWYIFNSLLKASSFFTILETVCCSFSVTVSLSSNLTSFVFRQVMLACTITQQLRTFIIPDLDIIPIRAQFQARCYPVQKTNVRALNNSLLLPVWFVQVHYVCVLYQSVSTNRIALICTLVVNLTKWALQRSSGSKIEFSKNWSKHI